MRCLPVVVALVIAAPAMAGKPSPEDVESYTEALERLPLEKHEIPEPLLRDPMPWEVGQWTLYRRTDKKGRVAVSRLSIVHQDDCGWWVESSTLDHKQRRSTVKICYSEMPRATDTVEGTAQKAGELVQVFITQDGDDDPFVMDLRTPDGAMMRSMMGPYMSEMIEQWDLDATGETETVTVQAGTFTGAIRADFDMKIAFVKVSGTGWVHPAVPVNGSVKVETNDGTVEELIDYGTSGATSRMPDTWAP